MADAVDLAAAYGKALLELGNSNPNVIVMDADLADSCQTEAFYQAFPGEPLTWVWRNKACPPLRSDFLW